MEQLLFLVSIIQKNIFNIPFFSQAAFVGALIILYRRLVDKMTIEPLDGLRVRHYAFLGIVILGQLFAFLSLSTEGYSAAAIVKKFLIAVIFVLNFVVLYFVVNLMMQNEIQVKRLIRGNFWAFIVLLVICLLQISYIYFHGVFSSLMTFIGRYLEYHNVLNPGSFEKISYVQSTFRVNGLYAESGFLAGVLAIGFAPFILGAIKNKINIFFPSKNYHAWFYYGMFLVLAFVLLLAKTSTGILAIAIIALLLLLATKGRERFGIVMLYLVMLALIFIAAMRLPALKNMLLSFTVGKTDSDSTTMRLLATEAVFITVLKNPIVGVGFGQTSHFNFINAPHAVKELNEYQLFLKNKEFPDQSAWGSVMAQFGVVVAVIVVIFIVRLLFDLRHQAQILRKNNVDDFIFDSAIADSAIFFFIIYFILGMLSIQWSFDLFILMTFFFINARHYLNNKIKTSLTESEALEL